MGDKTEIPYVDATWSPVDGCEPVGRGCLNCFAKRVSNRFHPERDFTDVQCHEGRLDQPLHWKKPRRILVPSMGDLFHKDVPDWFLDRVFAVMALAPQHTFMVLTKRPERMRDYLSVLPSRATICYADTEPEEFLIEQALHHDSDGSERLGNAAYHWLDTYNAQSQPWPLHQVCLGVSVEDQRSADERIPLLLQTPAAVRWVSAEPLLERIDLAAWLWRPPRIDQVVCGGESGPGARVMNTDWAAFLKRQCKTAGVAYYFKQLSQANAPKTFRDFESFPRDLQVREYPQGAIA